ncbi:hypothetical protein ACFOY4_01785 [Actinomadura syzygii]|nr:hypothetical protein [Actinomadura syzygii]
MSRLRRLRPRDWREVAAVAAVVRCVVAVARFAREVLNDEGPGPRL